MGQPDLTPLVEASGGPSSVKGSIWDSGEWWMLLAAQSMAVGTIMVRWVSKYAFGFLSLHVDLQNVSL